MAQTKITIEKLARVIDEGLPHTGGNEDMREMEGRLTARLDRIAHLLLAKQAQRLNALEHA